MIENEDCAYCGMPTEKVKSSLANGVDFDGQSALFTIDTLRCLDGHSYMRVDEDQTIK